LAFGEPAFNVALPVILTAIVPTPNKIVALPFESGAPIRNAFPAVPPVGPVGPPVDPTQ
jgi:hypothetical protein